MKSSLTNPSIAEKILALHERLLARGLENQALALWKEQWKMNDYIEKEFPLAEGPHFLSSEYLHVLHEREEYRAEYYKKHIQHFEDLLK